MYDVVIIGGGPAGYNAAIRAGQLGLRVVCVDAGRQLGGTCLNVGCIPAKSLLHASALFESARTSFGALGIEVAPTLKLDRMQAQKEQSVLKLTMGVEFLFRKNKVERLIGRGRIDRPGAAVVTGLDGAETRLETRHIVIATGSEPTPLPAVPFDFHQILSSTEALALTAVPASLIVIGAGAVGLELGSIWRRLGADVTVVEYLHRILPGADEEVAASLLRLLKKQGLTFKLGSRVTGAVLSGSGVDLALEPSGGGGVTEVIHAQKVLVAIGRRPFTRGLGLESVGITPDARGQVNHERFRTVASGVWAIGDVTSGPMLAHKAEEEAIACIETIAGLAGHVEYDLIPSVVYTVPEVASVGKTEEELKKSGVAYRVGRFQFAANSRARLNHETDGHVKVLAEEGSDRVLGVHMIGSEVSEMIGEYCVAMAFGATSADVALTCHPHPTRSEALRQAAMDVAGWATQA